VAWPRLRRLQEELGFNLEFSYAESELPEFSEGQLLRQYTRKHYELPPVNRVGGLDSRKEALK